ncbi:hypothetical protein [Cytobacillus gottheilii]|uniref:hypothetical protein n=1 Tax=Cytobacillus gottheilii TaxID=859144 RepID=UPI0009BA0C3F|nr:hypothetical protein [Cytobacillus gottheilii]
MKNELKLSLFITCVGLFLIVTSIILGIVGAEVLNIPFIRMDLVPIAIGFWGSIFFIVGVIGFTAEKNVTKEQSVYEKDERLKVIKKNAKSKAFNFLIVFFSACLLTLALLGYMNKVSFFTLSGLFIMTLVYYVYQLWTINKVM